MVTYTRCPASVARPVALSHRPARRPHPRAPLLPQRWLAVWGGPGDVCHISSA
ncbi:hypothetical protein JYU34_001697 [Plutella xylostella]|uniref:Uncharacterized protein n=1 Tax=Plutella xylostella TaxID=51655 RepID=A0ABQ7R4M7_PLUXY|nr:hypothetical protein JYU34_001697 [Plutella xylostella]